MQRRQLLGTIGTAGAATLSGCGLLKTECSPADDALGEVSIDRDDYDIEYDRLSKRSLTVRGAVVHETLRGVVIDDGTGLAELVARNSNEAIDQDTIDLGDCLEGSGPLNLVQSAENEVPYVEVSSLDGKGNAEEYEPLEDYPVPRFDLEYDRENDESVFRLIGGDPVTAGNLVVRRRAYGSEVPWPDAERARWHELTDVGADETVPEGSEVRYSGDQIDVSMLWRSPDRPWSHEVKSLGIGEMN